MDIEIDSVSKRFGAFTALNNVNLTVHPGELVALLGPSGSGKTTLLRIIAGMERPTSGRVLFGGQDLTGRSLRQRRVGFVFQHYALFRHMSVFENVAFGMRVKPRKQRPREKEIHERVMDLLSLVQLDPFAKRFPSQLSGGQRQRVALARALAIEPAVLLLDICHAGALGEGRRGSVNAEEAVKQLTQGTGIVVLSSSTGRELSNEAEQYRGGHGAFTAAVLEGLEGAADRDAGNRDGLVSIQELSTFVMRRVPELTRNAQHPTTPSSERLQDFPVAAKP